jgi:hypothetical protein
MQFGGYRTSPVLSVPPFWHLCHHTRQLYPSVGGIPYPVLHTVHVHFVQSGVRSCQFCILSSFS